MNNAVYLQTMENLRNIIDVKIIRKEREYFKWTSKIGMSQKYFTIT